MAEILVTYFSQTGNTESMAECIAEAADEIEGVTVQLRPVDEVTPDDLLDFNGIVMGSPVYYGTMAAPLKELIDASVKHHGRLEGKVGGAFSSSGVVGGGNETTLLGIIGCLLVHGMIVKGESSGPHYGPTCQGSPNDEAQEHCAAYGRDIAELCLKLFG